MRTILLLALTACDFQSTASVTTEADGGVLTDGAIASDAMSVTTCPGYTSRGPALAPSLYRIVTAPTRFKQAELSCEATGGHLLILDSDAEFTMVATSVPAGWIGFSDLKNDDTWIDVTGQPSPYMTERWASNEPSSSKPDNCASVVGLDNLRASNCGDTDGSMGDVRGYICECGDGLQGNTNNFKRSGGGGE